MLTKEDHDFVMSILRRPHEPELLFRTIDERAKGDGEIYIVDLKRHLNPDGGDQLFDWIEFHVDVSWPTEK